MAAKSNNAAEAEMLVEKLPSRNYSETWRICKTYRMKKLHLI